MRRFVSIAALLGAGCAVTPRAGNISPAQTLELISRAESERDGYSAAVRKGLGAQQRELRIAALAALARIEEAGTAPLAAPLLGDPDPTVAAWAAFALGQIGEPAGEAALITALGGFSVAPERVLLALGKSGTATAAREVARKLDDPKPSVRAAAATALGLLTKRHGAVVPSARFVSRLAALVVDPDRDVRFGAVYALMRAPSPSAAVALIRALEDPDAEVRANAARGLGAAHASASVLDAAVADPDWRVRVEVVRALAEIGATSEAEAPGAITRLTTMSGRELDRFNAGDQLGAGVAAHVLGAIIEAAARLGKPADRVLDRIDEVLTRAGRPPPERAADRARLACAIAFARDSRDGRPMLVKACGDATVLAWRRWQYEARLLARQGDDGVSALVELTAHKDDRVRVAAVESLADVEGPLATQALVALLGNKDPYVASAAAGALALPNRARHRPEGTSARLREALLTLVRLPDAGFAIAALDAIGALGAEGQALLPDLEALMKDPRPPIRRRSAEAQAAITGKAVPFGAGEGALPYELPTAAPGAWRVKMVTTRGPIVLELEGDLAPRTTGTFITLARSGFYKDRTFHRIVPDFVAQGGCPRGDGSGGPGYTIVDEASPAPFSRGAVGIATSGRDTGGSQFFFMHSHHPHLEGGYTRFGRVVEGMDVADALEQDDRILGVEVEAQDRPSK